MQDTQQLSMWQMSNDEINYLSFHLQKYHSIFNKFFQIGKPVFDYKQQTAAVWFNRKTADFIRLAINPKFWESCDLNQRLFIIAHECLHLILNHPTRMKIYKNSTRANYAADLVINHLCVEKFGFRRSEIDPNNMYCWVDKFFKHEDRIPTNQTFEYYYEKLGSCNIEDSDATTVDQHNEMEDASDFITEMDKMLSPEEKDYLKDMLNKHSEPSEAGSGGSSLWHFYEIQKIKKKKWETIIKKWSVKYIGSKDKREYQWVHKNRRTATLPSNLILPYEMEMPKPKFDKTKIEVYFFMDTSGSCHGLAERFFKAANSLPEERFNIRMFCFHDYVTEIDIREGKVELGGGTRFDIIEHKIQEIIKKENVKYPEGVFIITDGYGNSVNPEKPENWHWFLSVDNKMYVPKESKYYKLEDFE